MNKIKKLATVTLAVLILAVIPAGAFAAERQEAETAAHTHNYVYQGTVCTYISNDDATHIRRTSKGYQCSVCGEVKTTDGTTEKQVHYMGASSYTGENYHSGSFHHARYKSSCIQCGHVNYKWIDYQCPGNGNCILPQSVTPVPAEK
ncbi:MAG: hypothetical protein HDQ95_02785 [Roseburia sp.]|nr:hypothetical protein [Roseburia sp.]